MKKHDTTVTVLDHVSGPADLTPPPDVALSSDEQESLYFTLKGLVERYGEIAVSFELAEVRANRGVN